jgi:type IV pilus assembly protein PilM
MVSWLNRKRCSPIGVDIGSRCVKLVQLNAARTEIWETARWDLPAAPAQDAAAADAQVVEALRRAREGRNFHGREAVFALGAGGLFVQNIRVAPASGDELQRAIDCEAASRLPFRPEEAEVRFIHADDVRQGDTVRREVLVMACHRPQLARLLAIAEGAGLWPMAVDAAPLALVRCYRQQFRRDEDQHQRQLLLGVGASTTTVVITRGDDAMFIKYVELGGRHFDEAVAKHLNLPLEEAAALRRHNGDRRAAERDPDITRSLAESLRGVLERLAQEIALCLRYYSVTFRGQPLAGIVLGGGEAHPALAEWFATRLGVPCQLGNPLRSYRNAPAPGPAGQWDVAAGLALRETTTK